MLASTKPCELPWCLGTRSQSRWQSRTLVLLAALLPACGQGDLKDSFIPPTTPPFIALSQNQLTFSSPQNSPVPPQTVTVQNLGTGILESVTLSAPFYSPGQPTGWLTASVQGSPAIVTVLADPLGLAAGTYTATLDVSDTAASNSSATLGVTFTIVSDPVIDASPTLLRFAAAVSGANPASQTAQITNIGGGTISNLQATVNYAPGQPINWLSANLNSSTAPATLTLQASTAGLPSGVANATVTISDPSANSPFLVPVVFTIGSGPVIRLSSSTASFTAFQNAVAPVAKSITLTNAGGGTLSGLSLGSIAYGIGATGWLTATLSASTAPGTITVRPISTTLAPGVYIASIPVLSSDTTVVPLSIIVDYTLVAPIAIQVSSPVVNFAVVAGATGTPRQSVLVTNAALGAITGLSVGSISYAGGASGWLQTSFQATITPTALRLAVNPAGVAAGQYSADVTINSSTPGVVPATLSVTFVVSATAPSAMTILTGNNQSAAVGTPLPTTLVVRVFDGSNAPVPGLPVTWLPLGGSLSNTVTTTNSLGEASSNWQLGLIAGQEQVQVQTPGLAGVTFTATATSVPTAGYPNEPPGFTPISERALDARVEDGWIDRGDSRFTIDVDGSAPRSLPNIGRALFPLGWAGGSGPISTHLTLSGHTAIYVSFWLRFDPNWDGHSAYVNKIFHLWINGGNKAYLSAQSSNQSPLVPEIRLQGINESPVSRNLNGNVAGTRLLRGSWHRWEFVLVANNQGNADGQARWWIDGVLTGDWNNISFVPSGASHFWEKIDWNPTWGGTGDVVPAPQYMDIDHIYISGN